eukprot:PLAT1700.1.p2 GENE.PLAT1700.1~~PLAT1700.1.p2  ORF type:complete len:331 (+),score=164.35 PLAT1700.1:26-994(+)
MCESSAVRYSVGACCCLTLIAGSIMLGLSFSVLENNTVGLEYNTVAEVINEDQLYSNGRHFLGLGRRFIVYPTTTQNVKFGSDGDFPAIRARTRDGLAIVLEYSYNYKLVRGLLPMLNLYYSFGEFEEVTKSYNRIARDNVRSVSAEFDAFDFFLNRTLVENSMRGVMEVSFANLFATLDTVQLLSIEFPERFDNARDRQDKAFQGITKAQNDLKVADIEASTRVERANRESDAIVLDARAEAVSIANFANAQIASFQNDIRADEAAYTTARQELSLTDEEMLAYIWLQNVQTHGSPMMLNMDVPDVFKAFGAAMDSASDDN